MAQIPDFNVPSFFLSAKKPVGLGIAISGGGYRAFLNGAGFMTALDDRTYNSTTPGHLGGLLQSTSHIAGISGGSWILMSTVLNDFKPIVKLRHEWDMFLPLLEGIPSLKQMDVSRNDVQVLPSDFKDDDPDFYEKLNSLEKRNLVYVHDDLFNEFWDEFEGYLNDNGGTDLVADQWRNLLKREIPGNKEDDWFEGFKTFFRDLFKKKEDSRISTQNLLPHIEFTSDLSLKSMKKIFNFYKNLHLEVRAKKSQGFPVSFTDYWGRALSRRVFPKDSRSPNITFSNVVKSKSFQNFEMPLPIVISDLREPGIEKTSVNSNIFEFTPFEFGSWDMNMFVDLKYLGSLFFNGRPSFHLSNHSICFTNFDNAGFITGTSSSLFNNVFIYVWQLASTSSKINYRAIKTVLNTFGLTALQDGKNPKRHPDYALYTPNPFFRYGDPTSEIYNSKNLYMVDGGEDGQNIPFIPLLQKDRSVDVIFALDSTVDSKGWPNGTILQNTAIRFNHSSHQGIRITIDGIEHVINKFPNIPEADEFVLKELHKKPTFFGCFLDKFGKRNESNNEEVNDFLPPIIGYFANAPYSYHSNTSTFKLTYDYDEISSMLENGYNIATYANSTIDKDYQRCVGCILIKREFDRKERSLSLMNQLESPKFCEECYANYCYN